MVCSLDDGASYSGWNVVSAEGREEAEVRLVGVLRGEPLGPDSASAGRVGEDVARHVTGINPQHSLSPMALVPWGETCLSASPAVSLPCGLG